MPLRPAIVRPALWATLALLSAGALAAERTIKTRDGKVFTKAEITEIGAGAVKIVHENGINIVPMENLPRDVQKEVGYKSPADLEEEKERAEQEKTRLESVAAQARDEARRAAREKQLKAAFFAITTATPAEARAFAGLSRGALVEKLGEPLRSAQASSPAGGYTTLFYDERAATRTFFVFEDGKDAVTGGSYKGVPIPRP